ncbi:hypothetical protein [Pseudomonas sp. KCJK8993]|uniref:hypothetical protein n=1 Tax=Pseudomonas sp. KCJK8993 TaxID=3344565 RepID=UPI003905C570
MLRSKFLLSLPALLVGGALLWYMWMLTSAKFEWGGSSPDQQTLGQVQHIEQRAMEQYCTGVLKTPRGTWLVGRMEGGSRELELPATAMDLDALVYGKPTADKEPGEVRSFFGYGLGREPQVTYVSRLDDKGQFQLVARVGEAACLVASPDGATLFLLTGLDRPEGAAVSDPLSQKVVLRSDDQGQSWKWLPQGLFPKANSVAWNLKPYFHGRDEIWAWTSPQAGGDAEDDVSPMSSGVFYSADRGASSQEIFSDAPLLVDSAYASEHSGESGAWNDEPGSNGEVKSHVTQLDQQHAVIWISQRFMTQDPQHEERNLVFNVTTRARLQRQAGPWRVVAVEREDGPFIDELVESPDGQVIALLEPSGNGPTQVAQLDRQQLSWQMQGELPSVFAPLSSSSGLRESNFWAGRGALVINTHSRHHPPRWLYWGGEATVSAEGVFYSMDWGRSWRQLAVDGYLGSLGFDAVQDRLFWAKGNWYDSHDLGVYSYGLK